MKIIVGFAGGLLAVLCLLAVVPLPITERLSALREDGLRLVQVYERIVVDPRPIDVAFIGTSHTMNGVDDRGVQEALAEAGIRAHVVNLGVSWMGRDLHLLLTKELLAHKTPKLIVLEINEHEPPYGHPLMPYIASASGMLCCEFWTELNFPKMFLLFLKEQLRGSLSLMWPSTADAANLCPAWDFGWLPVDRIWQPEVAHNVSLGDKLEAHMGNEVRSAGYRLLDRFGDQTVRQIADLAHLNHAKIMFFYLPEYRYAADLGSGSVDYYKHLGPVLVPPQDLVANRLNWWDFAHLNRTGSVALVPTLRAALASYLMATDVSDRSEDGTAKRSNKQ